MTLHQLLTPDTPLPPATWRLLITEPATGSWNMAVDEAIATMSGLGKSPPTLRVYQWKPGTVSLGRHQPADEIDRERMRQHGYGMVRRQTGGRAILHIDELTYSIAGPSDEARLSGAVLDAYSKISTGLLLGLQRLGVSAIKAPGATRSGSDASPVCFEVPSAYEICVQGKKLMGSAQSRRAGYVLQHGSLPLFGDITRLIDVLSVVDESQRRSLRQLLAARATTVSDQLQRQVTFWEAATALIDGFNTALNLDFEQGDLTQDELALISELQATKYAESAWLERV